MLESLIVGQEQMALWALKSAWHIFLVLVGFCLVIFVHELGHFIMARLVGIRVEAFAIGFGPKVAGFKRGPTEYSIRAIPFGGFVKMLGQEDTALDQERLYETKADPESFLAKSVGQRALVVSGGVIMNVIFAAVAFMVVFMHGLERDAPVAGEVISGTPAAKAGIQPGDKFVRIGGDRVMHFGEVKVAIMFHRPGQPIDVELRRDGQTIQTQVVPEQMNPDLKEPMIGIAQARSTRILYAGLSQQGEHQLKADDVIVRVDSVEPELFWQVEQALVEARGKPVELTVERHVNGETKTLTVRKRAHLVIGPARMPVTQEEFAEAAREEAIVGLQPRTKFLALFDHDPNNPDPDRVQPLDVVVQVANIANPTKAELLDYFAENRGETVQVQVLRGEERKTAAFDVPRKKPQFEMLEQQLGVDDEHPIVADTLAGSPAAGLNLPRGARIVSCNGNAVNDWFDVIGCLRENAGQTVPLVFQLGDRELSGELAVPAQEQWIHRIGYTTDMIGYPMETLIKASNPFEGVVLGVRYTWYFIKLVYVTIQRIAIDQTVDARNVGGPVFIIHAGKTVAEAGLYKLLYFFALISANLAVVNFLPIPITDGGIMLLLAYEKIRGKPLPPKYAAIWQAAGLIFFILLFILLTYNDIRRIITGE